MTSSSLSRRLTVPTGAPPTRLDQYLTAELSWSRSYIQRLLRAGHITLNDQVARASQLVQPGDQLMVTEPTTSVPTAPVPDLPIVYEDTDLLVVDKPASLVTHPAAGLNASSVAAFARQHTTDPDPDRPGIVHRLDRDTSGLLIIAKTTTAKTALQQQFRTRAITKIYLALVTGTPEPAAATINLPLGRHATQGLRRQVSPAGRPASTTYHALTAYPGYSLVEAQPHTGRTHQLRVHLAAIGHPIAGDTTYGSTAQRPLGLARHFLHAAALEFTTPSGRHIKLTSSLPPDLVAALRQLQNQV